MSMISEADSAFPQTDLPLAMTDGARMVPAKTNAYWAELRAYWRKLGPDLAREAVLAAWKAAEPRGAAIPRRPALAGISDGEPFDMQRFSLNVDFIHELTPLPAGSEAAPFLDEGRNVVYKIFTPSPTGNIGWRLRAVPQDGAWRVDREPATLMDTMEKLALIHKAGGLPTEIAGTTPYLEAVAKQPRAYATEPGMATRASAVAAMNGVQIADAAFHGLRVLWVDEEAWLMGDLHPANIMSDINGQDRVIDALFMRVPAEMIAENEAVRLAVALAREKHEGGGDERQGELSEPSLRP